LELAIAVVLERETKMERGDLVVYSIGGSVRVGKIGRFNEGKTKLYIVPLNENITVLRAKQRVMPVEYLANLYRQKRR
jgi:SOS-response transcriptional repressor LexA